METETYSAILLHEDGTWIQPNFFVPSPLPFASDEEKEEEITRKLFAFYGRGYFMIVCVVPDDQCPEDLATTIWDISLPPDGE